MIHRKIQVGIIFLGLLIILACMGCGTRKTTELPKEEIDPAVHYGEEVLPLTPEEQIPEGPFVLLGREALVPVGEGWTLARQYAAYGTLNEQTLYEHNVLMKQEEEKQDYLITVVVNLQGKEAAMVEKAMVEQLSEVWEQKKDTHTAVGGVVYSYTEFSSRQDDSYLCRYSAERNGNFYIFALTYEKEPEDATDLARDALINETKVFSQEASPEEMIGKKLLPEEKEKIENPAETLREYVTRLYLTEMTGEVEGTFTWDYETVTLGEKDYETILVFQEGEDTLCYTQYPGKKKNYVLRTKGKETVAESLEEVKKQIKEIQSE